MNLFPPSVSCSLAIRNLIAVFLIVMAFGAKAGFAQSGSSELKYYAGLTFATDYVSNGISLSDNRPTLQPLFEVDWRGFYAGTVISLIRQGEDRTEFDYYIGYRKKLNNGMFVDTGYRRFYLNKSHDCCGEYKLRLLSPLYGDLGGEIYFSYDHKLDSFNKRGRLIWSVSDRWTASTTYGETSSNQNEYWDVGVTYALTKTVALDLRYQGAETGDAGLVARLSWATVQNSLARILANPLDQ